MRISYLIFIFVLLLCCCSTKTSVVYRIYNTSDPMCVMDSISNSGTIVSNLTAMSYITDDSVFVSSNVGTLYRDGKPTGSIHIQKKDSVYMIKILDNFKKTKK